MKSIMKKFTSVLLITAISLSVAACGNTKEMASDSQEKTKYKVGFSYNQFSDSLGINAKRAVQKAADTLGVEIVYNEDKGDGNAQIAAVENMISAGCQGILISPASEAIIPQLCEICEKNEVWLMTCFRDIQSQEVIDNVKNYQYYLGTVCEAEDATARKIVNIMAKDHQNVNAFYAPQGEVCGEQRKAAYVDESEKTGLNIVAEYVIPGFSNLAAYATEALSMFIESYPENTGVLMVAFAGGMGESAVAAVKSHNAVGKITMAGFDSFTNMQEAFDEGIVCAVATAHHADPFYAFLVLYNALSGHRLSAEQEKITLEYVLVTNSDECKLLNDYLLNEAVDLYTEEEIKNMTVEGNPDFTLDMLKAEMGHYNLEDIMERIETRKQ